MWIQVNKIKGYEQFRDCYFINELGQIRNMKLGTNLQVIYSLKYPTYRLALKNIRTSRGGLYSSIISPSFHPQSK